MFERKGTTVRISKHRFVATFKEFFEFAKTSNVNEKKTGLFAIQPEKIEVEPPIKVGYFRMMHGNIQEHIPQGIRVHAIGRLPARDQVYPTKNRDNVLAAEQSMLDAFKDFT